MKLSTHPVSSTKIIFEEGLNDDVEHLQIQYRQKLEEEYSKPNPFDKEIESCTLLLQP